MKKIALLLGAALLSLAAHAADTTRYSKTVSVAAEDRVYVSNVAGSVHISTWDRREMEITGELGSDVKEVEVRAYKGGVEIRVRLKEDSAWFERRRSWENSRAHLQIQVPADAMVEASTVSASLTTRGLRGRTRLKTVSGLLRADLAAGDLDAKTVSGRLEVSGNGSPGRLRADSVSGDVILSSVGGDVEGKTTSGSVDADLRGADDVELSTVSGRVDVRGTLAAAADVELKAVNGRVKMGAQMPGGFRYELKTFNGRISTCFNSQKQDDERRRNGDTRSGVHGEGRGSLSARSMNGNVDICDR